MNFVNSFRNPARQAELMVALRMVAESGNYNNGLSLFRLEKFFTTYQGKASIAFNSGGSAFYSLYRYYAAKGHREVAIQNNSFVSTGAMALEAGYNVHLIDSGPHTPSMGYESLLKALESNRYITMVVISHIGGWLAADYDMVAMTCMERDITLIEDCSHAIGVDSGVLLPGKLGDASVWGFQAQGAVPVGEGGIVCTNDLELRDFCRKFRAYGRYMDGGIARYGAGMSIGMSEWASAVAYVQLQHMKEIVEARKRDAMALQSIAPCKMSGHTNYTKYPVDPAHAAKRHTTSGMYALSDQLAHALPKSNRVKAENLPHSTRWAQNHKCLPIGEGLYDGMDEKQIHAVLKAS